jgi:predicted transcriptional regulator
MPTRDEKFRKREEILKARAAPAEHAAAAGQSPPSLHELESQVMDEVWRQGEASVRGVMEALNKRSAKERAYTTYMTIMSRLNGKEMLERRREGKTDFYSPMYTREKYADLRAQAEVDSVVDQFGDLALAHLARQMAQMDPQRRRALQRLARGE